jgi:DNA-directed RNA polymerase sigma subunit (sigma70/sigma32)
MEAEVETQVRASVEPDIQQGELVTWVVGEYDFVRPKRREIREATVLAIQEDRVQQIADALHISRERVRQIEARALRRLRYATARHDLEKIRAQI